MVQLMVGLRTVLGYISFKLGAMVDEMVNMTAVAGIDAQRKRKRKMAKSK